jgi:uncharacterized MAPEG superfamily protein
VTIAYWCVLAAIFFPYLCFGIARNRARSLRDNRNPRDFPNRIEGLPKRAWDAQLNSFESLPGFAAAVIIAHLAGAQQVHVDTLALAWVVVRLGFIVFYLTDRSRLRSAAQLLSLACVLGLFIAAASA